MPVYKLTDAAANDIENILNYSITQFGLLQAETYYTNLTHCLQLLDDNPAMGVDASDLRQGYRRFLHESHVIFYTTDNSGILVIRILHKHLDAVRNLHEDF